MTAHNATASTITDSPASLAGAHTVPSDEAVSQPAGASSDAGSHEHIDGVRASLHEQLEALVQVLTSGNERESESEEEMSADDFALPESFRRTDPNVDEPEYAAESIHLAQPDFGSGFAKRNVLNSRVYGFLAGFAMSVALGGAIMLTLGVSEPPAVAANHAVVEEEQVAAVAAAPNGLAKMPAPESAMPAAHTFEQVSMIGVEKEQGSKSSTREVSVASLTAANESRSEGNLNEPASTAHANSVSNSILNVATKDEPNSNPEGATDSGKSADTMHFETTVEAAAGDREQISQSSGTAANAEHNRVQERSTEQGRMARVIEHVNMRAGPNTREPVVAIVSEGSPVEVVRCTHWCEVIFAGQRGWIYKGYIHVAGAGEVSIHYN